jgi:malonyl-CoA/methylmalonyl-CoA synthetase
VPENLYESFQAAFPENRSKTLLTESGGRTWSYDDAEKRSAQAANWLVSSGLNAGERITVQVDKSPEFLWLYLGAVRAGIVFHPLNDAYTSDELAYFLRDAEPALVVCDPAREGEFAALCDAALVPRLETLAGDGSGSLTAKLAHENESFETVASEPDDLAALLYSSGTTGQPKGVMLTHRNLVWNTQTLVDYWGFTDQDCLLHALPVFHVHGLFVAIGCVMMSGASMKWLSRFQASTVVNELPGCSVMMGVPTYYTRLLSEAALDAGVCDGVRLFISGSAPLLEDTFKGFESRTGQTILERYGMTETGMNTSNPLQGERRAGTVGHPLPGVQLRITGSGHAPVADGEVGDIEVQGPNVFAGYWRMPEKTAEEFTADGFFVTGDKGRIDEDGYLSIVGRSKDLIITGGLNVYPKEIELIIDAIPGVLESAVIGLPHADFGEAVAAVVVREPDAVLSSDKIANHVRQHAAAFKVPKRIFFVDSLPRNAMGKVQKNQLRSTLR